MKRFGQRPRLTNLWLGWKHPGNVAGSLSDNGKMGEAKL
jgi:hypothetical protein